MNVERKVITYKGKRVFEKLVMFGDFKRAPKYFVEDEACFLFIKEGSFQFRTPTNLLGYSKNEIMLAKCGNYFLEDISLHEPNRKLEAIGVFFYPEMVKSFFETDLSTAHFANAFDVVKVSMQPLLKSFIVSLEFLLDNPTTVDDNMIIIKLKELLLILSKTESGGSIKSFVNSLFVPHVYEFNDVIQNNMYADLSLSELATLCNCSLATFKRRFKDLYKESPSKYILAKRLERASELLRIKAKPVSDIVFECGFESASHFSKAFKKHFHKSPSEFRLS